MTRTTTFTLDTSKRNGYSMASVIFSQVKNKIGTVLLLASLSSQTHYKCCLWEANALSFIISVTCITLR